MDVVFGSIFIAVIVTAAVFIIPKMMNGDGIELMYLGGHPDLRGPKRVVIQHRGDCISFRNLEIYKDAIMDINLTSRSTGGKAVAGAAAGGLIAGPIGLLAGAAMGSANSQLIQLTVDDSGISYDLFFGDHDAFNKYAKLKRIIGEYQLQQE
ncbi:MAG: hypothetical protein ACYCX4_15585 [Bacillota bacterium]